MSSTILKDIYKSNQIDEIADSLQANTRKEVNNQDYSDYSSELDLCNKQANQHSCTDSTQNIKTDYFYSSTQTPRQEPNQPKAVKFEAQSYIKGNYDVRELDYYNIDYSTNNPEWEKYKSTRNYVNYSNYNNINIKVAEVKFSTVSQHNLY